ncbi:MAG: hypothetical protein RLN88_13890 [Ekhidna sp.]|uniref:hypothetical protein n=1 Tax=Ekhidna sp. TaxID=2608089 RepID=UPI0032ED512A
MKMEDKVRQHDELMGELIQMHQDSSKRLRIMENVQAIAIPVLLILGISGLAAFLKAFGIF